MKNVILTITVILASIASTFANKNVDLKLSPKFFDVDNSALYVDVELKYTEKGTFVLAGQNFRIFFDSEKMHLNAEESNSELPTDLYSNLEFADQIENVDASNVGDLTFDAQLGFANFSIDLNDNKNGGLTITQNDGWVAVATLKFDVLNDANSFEVIWGQFGKTDQYATAFAEVAEWVAPFSTSSADVNLIDLNMNNSEVEFTTQEIEVAVGPNPTADFLRIQLGIEAVKNINVVVRDMSGRVALTQTIFAGEVNTQVNVQALSAGTYIVDMMTEAGSIYTEKIVVAK